MAMNMHSRSYHIHREQIATDLLYVLEHHTDRTTGEGMSDGVCGGLLVLGLLYRHASTRCAQLPAVRC
jgi:hypothetical protein